MRKYFRVQCEPRGFPQLNYILQDKFQVDNKNVRQNNMVRVFKSHTYMYIVLSLTPLTCGKGLFCSKQSIHNSLNFLSYLAIKKPLPWM